MNKQPRYSNTNEIGVSILNLCVSKYLNWICRITTNSDVGIDATIEQVIDGYPTAKYISIQLKTGEGNVYKDNDGNFIYYIDRIHYDYWLNSSIPTILAYCDPKSEIIYWELLKKHNITKLKKEGRYKIKILNSRQLNKNSLSELNVIIDTYQIPFNLANTDAEIIYDVDYWSDLLESCAETISNSTRLINQLDNRYKIHSDEMTKYIDTRCNQNNVNKYITKHTKAIKLAIDICKTQLKNQIPIIAQTHIEAIRLVEYAINNIYNWSSDIMELIIASLNLEVKTIINLKGILQQVIEKFSKSTSPYDLRNSEYSFSLIMKEYEAELDCIVFWIEKLINTIKDKNNI